MQKILLRAIRYDALQQEIAKLEESLESTNKNIEKLHTEFMKQTKILNGEQEHIKYSISDDLNDEVISDVNDLDFSV